MRLHGPLTVDDVLQALVSRTARIPSNCLQNSLKTTDLKKEDFASEVVGGVTMRKPKHVGDPWRHIDQAELSIGREIGVLRCMADLAAMKHTTTRRTFSLGELYQKAPHRAQGEIVLLCLRSYHERALKSKERALAEVYAWSRRLEGLECDAATLAQDFREGRCARLRKKASAYYADALLILGEFIRIWNRKSLESFNRG